MIININGTFKDESNATISIFDRGFLFGDSIYEVTRTYNHIPFLIEDHLERLKNSAMILGLQLSYSLKELQRQIDKTLQEFWKTTDSEAYIRIIITRGEGDLSLAATTPTKNNMVIIVKSQAENPTHWYNTGVRFVIADNCKTPRQTIDPNCKSGNHLPHVMALHQARSSGAFDAILLNQQGYVTEGTSNNIWIVKDGVIKTPPLQSGILEGLTRKSVLQIIDTLSLTATESLFYPQEAYDADECFFTSSTRELVPIIQIDEFKIGTGKPGQVYQQLHAAYHQFIQSYNTNHTK